MFKGVEIFRTLGQSRQEAVGIVILEETQNVVDVRIDIVVAHMLENSLQTALFLMERLAGDTHQPEIHNCLQARVLAIEVEPAAFLPIGGADRIVHPGFTDDVVVWIFGLDRLAPLAHHRLVCVGISILADAIDTAVLDPPDGILDQVFRHMRILLVEVGHRGNKPAVQHPVAVVVGSVRIEVDLLVVICLHVIVQVIEPVLARDVLHPGMIAAAVVEDHVHNDLHTSLVSIVDEVDIFLVGAETWVYTVIVGCRITVIGTTLHIIFQYGIEPDCRDAQVLDIIHVLFDACKVATVAGVGVITVYLISLPQRNLVVVGVAVGETVRHDQIENIR